MTTLYVLASGSRGNCFALESGGDVLLLDAGLSCREIERRAERVGLDPGRISGVVLTHEHGDHCAGVARLVRRHAIPVYASAGTWRCLAPRCPAGTRHQALDARRPAQCAGFQIECAPTSHDAAEPLAVLVETPTGQRIGVAYDLGRPTTAVRYLLRDASALILEANHDDVLLRTSGYPPVVQQRIAGSGGHLSNRVAAELLLELLHPGLGLVVLVHLSERCNSAEHARAAVEPRLAAAGFSGMVKVARQDEPLEPLPLRRVVRPRPLPTLWDQADRGATSR